MKRNYWAERLVQARDRLRDEKVASSMLGRKIDRLIREEMCPREQAIGERAARMTFEAKGEIRR